MTGALVETITFPSLADGCPIFRFHAIDPVVYAGFLASQIFL
jgi:hypothetical protein